MPKVGYFKLEFFKEEVNTVKRGENAYNSSHVKECVFVNNNLKGESKYEGSDLQHWSN